MDIIKNRKKYFALSLFIIGIGLIMFMIKGLNYDIDFTGGTLIQMNADRFIATEEIRSILDEYDENISIIHGGSNQEEIIMKTTLDFSNTEITEIISVFENELGINRKNITSEKVGPTMGEEIRDRALLSIAIATVLMLIYITFRFEFKFAVAAVIALVHDILIGLSVYAVLQIPVNTAFIAALLTIVGYSINDTIVLFDRIREEIKLNPNYSNENLVNDSIKKSIRRTINTSFTTLAAVTLLYIFGVEDVKVLALPLIMGIISGTYSSIFIAPPIWYNLKEREVKTAK